jgi:hypothetical protein
MTTYLFLGLVLPERAPLTLQIPGKTKYANPSITAELEISIWLNQVVVWAKTESECNIFDLGNLVREVLQTEIAIIGYLKGYTFTIEIRRVLNPDFNVDYVFGIDILYIEERNQSIDLSLRFNAIREKLIGEEGILVSRCFKDLISAMNEPGDTGFYCYRAIESLLQHYIVKHKVISDNRSSQWKMFREFIQCEKQDILSLKEAADPIRHGKSMHVTSEYRRTLLLKTWDIVDSYIEKI